jgi:hypothetical protein
MCVWKGHRETHYSAQLLCVNKETNVRSTIN